MDEQLQWWLAGVILLLLVGWLGYRAFKRADAKQKSKRAQAEAAARAEAQRAAAQEAHRREAAQAEALRVAAAEAARVRAARLAAEEAARAQAEGEARRAAEAKREAARAEAQHEAARAEAARVAAAELARAQAARLAAQQAAQAEALRQAADAAARAQAARLAADVEARAREAQAAAVAKEAARLDEERRAAALAPAQLPAVVSPAAAKTPDQTLVMVADDSKVVRIKTGRLLAQHQYRVTFATDGLDAAQQMQTSVPDIVITDVEMPGMDGFELTRHVRQNPLTAHIPVIMITAADDRHREDANRAGVSVLLGKPYPEDELIAHIRQAMNPGHAPSGALAE